MPYTWRGSELKQRTRQGAVRGVNMAIERLRGHSVEKAPLDQGDLRGSATVLPAVAGDATPTATLVFDEPYAAAQHEHTEYQHPVDGEAKYVQSNYEDPARRDEYRDLIGKGIADAWG